MNDVLITYWDVITFERGTFSVRLIFKRFVLFYNERFFGQGVSPKLKVFLSVLLFR